MQCKVKCRDCKKLKLKKDFHKSPAWKSGHNSRCAACCSKKRRLDPYRRYLCTTYKKKTLDNNKLYVLGYLMRNPCIDCGLTDPQCLTFDHVRGRKIDNISRMLVQGSSRARILAEIAKCEVRCFNCHSIRTHEQFKYYRRRQLLPAQQFWSKAS